jgi:hypothetical protein
LSGTKLPANFYSKITKVSQKYHDRQQFPIWKNNDKRLN